MTSELIRPLFLFILFAQIACNDFAVIKAKHPELTSTAKNSYNEQVGIGSIGNPTYLTDGQTRVTGWACIVGDSSPVQVSIYAGAKRSENFIASVVANQKNEPTIDSYCGANGNFRFIAVLPAAIVIAHASKHLAIYFYDKRTGLVELNRSHSLSINQSSNQQAGNPPPVQFESASKYFDLKDLYNLNPNTTGPRTSLAGLSLHVGAFSTSANNQIIEDKEIIGDFNVKHSGVTIRNCKIKGTVTIFSEARGTTIRDSLINGFYGWQAIRVDGTDTLIDHIEAHSSISGVITFGKSSGIRIRRSNLYGSQDGIKFGTTGNSLASNVIIEENYIHDLMGLSEFQFLKANKPSGLAQWKIDAINQIATVAGKNPHSDGIQSWGSKNVIIRNNRVEAPYKGQNSAIIIQTENDHIENWKVEHNLFSGGGHTLFLRHKKYFHYNNLVRKNFWVRDSYSFSPRSIDLKGICNVFTQNTFGDSSSGDGNEIFYGGYTKSPSELGVRLTDNCFVDEVFWKGWTEPRR